MRPASVLPGSPKEHEEAGQHNGAAEDGRETRFFGEYQPGEERRDHRLGEVVPETIEAST
jgi:hypothetical protein